MFSMLSNLTKAAVAVTLSPVALAVDIVTLPDSASSFDRGPFDRTANLLGTAGECVKRAVKPEK